jgi:putative transposase
MLTWCEQPTRTICDDLGAELAGVNCQTNHVHPLVTYPPKVAVSALVNSLKGLGPAPATGIHRPGDHALDARCTATSGRPPTFAASCGGAPPSIIGQHIEQQDRPG